MWEPTEQEAEDCLEHGKSCSFGICSECVIGITGGYNNLYYNPEDEENVEHLD